MASIGSETFVILRGVPDPLAEQIEDVTRPGVDGHAARKRGQRARTFSMRSILDVTTAEEAKTRIEAYMDLAGTIVDVVDGHGVTWSDVLVLSVEPQTPKAAKTISGGKNVNNGEDGIIVRATWRLRLLS